jgi:16S rRNA (cytosine967-C5)-methyltransferase
LPLDRAPRRYNPRARPVPQSQPLAETLAAASRIVGRVIAGRSLGAALADEDALAGGGRPAVADAVYGTLRDYGAPDAIVVALTRKGPPDPSVRALLLCALHELRHARRAPHIVVDQAVAACARLGKGHARGFVNAALRNYLRQRELLERAAARDDVGRFGYPQWWVDRVRTAFPDHWQALLAAGNAHPPLTLRVNRRRAAVEEVLARLDRAEIGARRIGQWAIRLERPRPVHEIPGFGDGEVSVQDAGAQLAAPLLAPGEGMRVLDACAAPGGKTGHLAELADADLVALDRDAARLARIEANLARLGLRARVRHADAADVASWWDGRAFDRILADVPCSASGVVRRHPDIKWLRRAADLAGFAREQLRLLEALWQVLAPGGKLLYATCSVFPEENDAVVAAFAARRSDARRLDVPGLTGGQLLPDDDRDGFFYALLEKTRLEP